MSEEIVKRILQNPKIDTHCHCRDGNQRYKATIKEVMDWARNLGIVALGDMPNKYPPITKKHHVYRWVKRAERQGCLDGYYLYIGATKNPDQIREVARIATQHPKVLGPKFFTTGGKELTISEERDQFRFYRTLAECEYTGVVPEHCEKESLFKMQYWDPIRPWTWNDARPSYAQTASIEDNIKSAIRAGFEGTLYFLHVTTGEQTDLIDSYRGEIDIVCGATPQHLLFSTLEMAGSKGLKYKVNPPIRHEYEVESLREGLVKGKIDWIESDHAPHTYEEKFTEKGGYLSGCMSYELYPRLIDSMVSWGLSEEQIMNLMYHNAKRTFPKIIQ